MAIQNNWQWCNKHQPVTYLKTSNLANYSIYGIKDAIYSQDPLIYGKHPAAKDFHDYAYYGNNIMSINIMDWTEWIFCNKYKNLFYSCIMDNNTRMFHISNGVSLRNCQ